MLDWNIVLTVVASNAVTLLVVGYIGKTVVERWLNRRATEHQVRFTVVHERVADTIEGLYTRLDVALRTAKATVAELEIGEVDKNQLAEDAYMKAGEFLEYLWPHRLYLSDDLASRLEKLARSLRLEIRRFKRGINPGNKKMPPAPNDFWERALEKIEDEASAVFAELRSEFQRIIGLPRQ